MNRGSPNAFANWRFLATARELNHQFEWVAHEPAALKVGISQEIVDIIKYRKPVDRAR